MTRSLKLVLLAVVLLFAPTASAQWTYPTGGQLQFQINGTGQTGVTTVNAPAGSSLLAGVLTLSGGGGGTGTSPFAIGTNLVLTASGLTAPRTFSWPDATDTVCTLAATQTLSGKTLTAPVVNGLTSSGSTAINFGGSSGTFAFPTGGVSSTVQLSGYTAAANANTYDLSAGTGTWKTPSGAGTISGSVTVSSSASIVGPLVTQSRVTVHRITVADLGYTVLAADTVIAYTSISAARVVSMNPGVGGTAGEPMLLVVKDESGSASATNTITVTPTSGTIDGAASKVCVNSAFGACRFYCNGTNCFTW